MEKVYKHCGHRRQKQYVENFEMAKMSSSLKLLVVAVVIITCASAAKLPSYITPCKRDQATLTECATKEANKVLPRILQGDKDLKIPVLDPLKLPEVKFDAGQLKIKLIDIVLTGFDDYKFDRVGIDLDKQHIDLKVKFPRLNLLSKYEINGQILILPIRGNGPANITFVGGEYDYDTDFELAKRGNEEYLKLKNPKMTYTTTRSYYILDNLFDGDKTLGDQMNKFLDENWQDVSKDLGPAISEVVAKIATTIAGAIFDNVPFDEIIPK